MVMYGYNHRTCECEDFPCCGHNDVDPNWVPDPYDAYDDNDMHEPDEDDADWCVLCEDPATVDYDGERLCGPCLTVAKADRSRWVHAPRLDGSACIDCGAWDPLNADALCRHCHKKGGT